MNTQQQKAIELALGGHNLLLLGAAGTGKSYVVKEIASSLQKIGKKVQITCSTGIACSVYDDACTIHQFTGISDGRHGPEEIVDVVKNSRRFEYVINNITTTDTIIVDECSMISKRVFDTINRLCTLKHHAHHFGGIQIIFSGDLLQLPPVANPSYGDEGHYCFQSEDFEMCFPHRVMLTETLRQNEKHFVEVIKEVYDGKISPASEELLVQLRRPLQDGCKALKLFSKNDLVDDFNRKQILDFPGLIYEYTSKDSGNAQSLKDIPAPHTLWIKIGCPVILLRNISKKLVNGLQGYVEDIQEGIDPVIVFPSIRLTTTIPKVKFAVYSPELNTDIAVREQYPLKLAFGLTIHKAQGMTLDRAEVDCREIFRAGQLGVAISRVTSSAGLRVLNYHPRYIIPPPQSVRDFMDQASKTASPDLSCCRNSRTPDLQSKVAGTIPCNVPDEDVHDIEDIITPDSDEEFDEEFDSVINQITSDEAELVDFDIPAGFNIDTVMQDMIYKEEVTETHTSINRIIRGVNQPRLCTFVKKFFLKCSIFAKKLTGKTSAVPEKNIMQFYRLLHEFCTSAEYSLNCMMLFQDDDFSESHRMVCYNIVEAVRIFFLKQKVELLKVGKCKLTERHVTDTSRARVRYVAGYCLATLRKKYTKMQRNHMYDKTRQGQDKYSEAKWVVSTLSLLNENENYLKSHTDEPDSLLDIERRQYKSRGLTNVNDGLYKFFVHLTEKCMSLLVHENLMKFGKNMYNMCLDKIQDDLNMYEQFCKVVVASYSEQPVEEFDDPCEVNGVVEKLVLISSETFKIYHEITGKYLMVLLSQFRKDLKSAFRVEKTMAHRKQIKVSKRQSECGESTTSKKSKPQKGTDSAQDLDICQSCFGEKDDQWIQCDSCRSWFHRSCAGLKSKGMWKKFNKENVSWSCCTCT